MQTKQNACDQETNQDMNQETNQDMNQETKQDMNQETNQEMHQEKKPVRKKRKPGPKSSYREEYADQAMNLCRLGATDTDIARFFGVSDSTVDRWKAAQPEFLESLKKGKIHADVNVADRVYQRALGYTHDEVRIFLDKGNPVVVPYKKHYPPDTQAGIFWLKNRRPDLWREKVTAEISGPDGSPLQAQGKILPTPEVEAVLLRIANITKRMENEAKSAEGGMGY